MKLALVYSGALAALLPCVVVSRSVDVVLSDRVMELTNYTAYLSALAYEEAPPQESDMEFLDFFDEEPDQAIVVKAHGYCFGVFRGTTLTWEDWSQNLEVGYADICDEQAEETTCCTTRRGFFEAYNTTYKPQVEDDLRECAKTCENKDECVVLTGHSQGGAIAAVAGVALASLNPYVITFGQPPTILAPCERITSERWYRWVNTKESKTLNVGISYDPVPFVPGLGADFFGHMIIISSDDTGVAYIGLDAQDYFSPLNVGGFEAHSMFSTTQYPGYADRIKKIMKLYTESGNYPIRADGFVAGSFCTESVECESLNCAKETGFSWLRCVGVECARDDDCDSQRCDSGVCVPKLGSCARCDEDSDCQSNVCSWRFRCAESEDGLMGDECLCNLNRDCASGRCEGTNPPICEARLADGASCNEHSDCISDKCSWGFHCVAASSNVPTSAIEHEENAKEAPALTNEKPSMNIVEILITVAVIVVICFFLMRWCWSRRAGYEEIPTRLNV